MPELLLWLMGLGAAIGAIWGFGSTWRQIGSKPAPLEKRRTFWELLVCGGFALTLIGVGIDAPWLLIAAIWALIGLFWVLKNRRRFAMRWRIAKLTEAERADILAKSPFEAGYGFQGDEWYSVWPKDSTDVADIFGSFASQRDAENWVTARWLEEEDKHRKVG